MYATALLDLTDFGDAETFRSLLNKHGLQYNGIRSDGVTQYHSWEGMDDEDIELRTSCNPIDGYRLNPVPGTHEPGYASYLTVAGDVTRARSLLRDIFRDAEHVKGVEQHLTAADGTPVLVSED